MRCPSTERSTPSLEDSLEEGAPHPSVRNTEEAQKSDQTPKPDFVFTKIDLQDVVPHDNDPVVISVVTVGRKVHHVLVDQGSSAADVMF